MISGVRGAIAKRQKFLLLPQPRYGITRFQVLPGNAFQVTEPWNEG